MGGDVLGVRALNRATLARQHLLTRGHMRAADALEHLVGMQGQAPLAPYVGLWSRLDGFQPDELATLITGRQVVRAPLMRGTVHMVTDRDCLSLRPLVQQVLERTFSTGQFAKKAASVDKDELLVLARALVEERPRTRTELGRLLGERWPTVDPGSLSNAVPYLLPLLQVTPRGIWGERGQATWTTIESWLGRALDTAPSRDDLVLRYLAAFGPATVMDVQAWCGLTKLSEVIERVRPRLRVFRSEEGRELFDLPNAPRPDADTPAPPRFLPEYDNLLFGHALRTRVIEGGVEIPLFSGNGARMGTLLLDGFFRGVWRIEVERGTAVLLVEPFVKLTGKDTTAVADEGLRLLRFAAAESDHQEVRFAPQMG